MSDLCPKHDLVTDEHGLCAHCREELSGTKKAGDSPASLGVVGLVVAVAVTAGVWLTSTGKSPTQAVQSAASAAASATNAVGDVARGFAQSANAAASASAAPSASGSAEPVRAFDLEVRKKLEEAERKAKAAESASMRSQVPPPAKLEALRKRVVVDMYRSTPCEECDVAASWMREREIQVRQHDVTRDGLARERLLEINPSGSVPTFDIGGEVLPSFGPTEILRAIDVAALHGVDDE